MKCLSLLSVLFCTLPAFSQNLPQVTIPETQPLNIGVIDQLYSKELGEKRVLNIYLPEGYNTQDSVVYPVTYLLDGSVDEDFIHVAGLYQFNSFEWINRAPKSIVVGIATVDRRRDYTLPTTVSDDKKKYPTSGHSDKFIAFIEKDLQPFIEKKYKAGKTRTIIGQSLGGLLATEILLKKPTLFNKYIIISPSLWWNNGSLLNESSALLQDTFSQKTAVYIAVGKEGLTPSTPPRVMEVDANLLAEKIKSTRSKNVSLYFDYLPQEDHATIAHQAIANAFKFIYTLLSH
ncbi:esterase [Filimonas zeae]|uniref:Esterase n=2 Tax=Filimonas zeae TaxID=1737353 RepID=A0A917MRG2_9BACT|nr:esterase [Filimonas zeae]